MKVYLKLAATEFKVHVDSTWLSFHHLSLQLYMFIFYHKYSIAKIHFHMFLVGFRENDLQVDNVYYTVASYTP